MDWMKEKFVQSKGKEIEWALKWMGDDQQRYDAWKELGDMKKVEAMNKYMKKIKYARNTEKEKLPSPKQRRINATMPDPYDE